MTTLQIITASVLVAIFLFSLPSLVKVSKLILTTSGKVTNSVDHPGVPPVMEPLIEALSDARRNVRIFAAELDLRLFNHTAVTEAFDKAANRRVKIEIICGPLLLVESTGKDAGKNPFWERYKNIPYVRFYLRRTHRNINHGTIVDDGAVMILEDYHEPGEPDRNNYVYRSQQGSDAKSWIETFDRLTKDTQATVPLTQDEMDSRKVSLPADQLLAAYERNKFSYAPPPGRSGILLEEGVVMG